QRKQGYDQVYGPGLERQCLLVGDNPGKRPIKKACIMFNAQDALDLARAQQSLRPEAVMASEIDRHIEAALDSRKTFFEIVGCPPKQKIGGAAVLAQRPQAPRQQQCSIENLMPFHSELL